MIRTGEASRRRSAGHDAFCRAEKSLAERDIAASLELYQEAEQLGYDADACAGARWICHMLLGDFDGAWRESDAIARRGRPDPNRFWSGRPLAGKRVLVRCLHGLGDTLQYSRFLPLLRKVAAGVTVEAQPQLKELLSVSGIADGVITWGEPEPLWDEQIEIVELPLIFRATLAALPAQVPYLSTGRPVDSGASRKGTSHLPRIGLLWGSSAYNPERSVPLPVLARVCHAGEAHFLSLQQDPARAELTAAAYPIRDISPRDANVLETARLVCSLDLLITVDTMLAHLAGALGRTVWLLLPFAADWRWMLDRRDSPWYPTMRLFRQREPSRCLPESDWLPVIDEVRAELTGWLADKSALA